MTDEIKTWFVDKFVGKAEKFRLSKGNYVEVIKLTDLIALLEKRKTEILKGCGEDYCGKLIYHKDTKQEDTLCVKCNSKYKEIQSLLNQLRGEKK